MYCRSASWLLLALLAALVFPVSFASAQTPIDGMSDPANWFSVKLYLQDQGWLPNGVEPVAGLAAAYNYSYDATVLGVNFKVPDSVEYYAAMCLVDADGNLDVLESLGPFRNTTEWDAGRYYLAAGTPEGDIVCWLTAPREYPRAVTLTSNYQSGTRFSIVVTPPPQAAPEWKQWLVTVAWQTRFQRAINISHVGGDGRNRGGLPGVATESLTEALMLSFRESDYGLIPYLMVGRGPSYSDYSSRNTSHSISIYHYIEEQAGWLSDGRLSYQSFPQGFWLADSALVAYADYGRRVDPTEGVYVELVNNLSKGPHVLRPGTRGRVAMDPEPQLLAFLDAGNGDLPYLLMSNERDLSFGRLYADPGLPTPLGYSELIRRTGEVGYLDGEPYPLYPVTALATTARWDTGHPEVYWVQDGDEGSTRGQLLRLRYAP